MASISLRSVARALDPVAPSRRLGGRATDIDLDWDRARGNTADETLHRAIRATGEGPVGLFQHPEKGLLQLHRWSPAERAAGKDRSLRALAARHGEDRMRHRLLVWNTWLIDPPFVAGPPDRKARIAEIGEALDASGCDIIATIPVGPFAARDSTGDLQNDLREIGCARQSGLWLTGEQIATARRFLDDDVDLSPPGTVGGHPQSGHDQLG